MFNVSSRLVREHADSFDIILVNKAGKINSTWANVIYANVPKKPFVFVGDIHQTGPFEVETRDKTFAEQLHDSELARAIRQRRRSVVLYQQHRMVVGINDVDSELFYDHHSI